MVNLWKRSMSMTPTWPMMQANKSGLCAPMPHQLATLELGCKCSCLRTASWESRHKAAARSQLEETLACTDSICTPLCRSLPAMLAGSCPLIRQGLERTSLQPVRNYAELKFGRNHLVGRCSHQKSCAEACVVEGS